MDYDQRFEEVKNELRIIIFMGTIFTTLDNVEFSENNSEDLKFYMISIYVTCAIGQLLYIWFNVNQYPNWWRIQTGLIINVTLLVLVPAIVHSFNSKASGNTQTKAKVLWYANPKEKSTNAIEFKAVTILLELLKQFIVNVGIFVEVEYKVQVLLAMFWIVKNW